MTSSSASPSNFSSLVGPTEVKNIALFGLDGKSDQTRSDCIVIVSIDPKLKKVKMVSVMRDSYVDINGSMDKIGHAYAYGGRSLQCARSTRTSTSTSATM